MPSDDSSVGDALSHQSLKVSRDDPGPRPMVAVLDARPGLAGQLRLQTQPVHDFIASVPALSSAQPGSLVQLDEITVR
jgi:hypothetical protein